MLSAARRTSRVATALRRAGVRAPGSAARRWSALPGRAASTLRLQAGNGAAAIRRPAAGVSVGGARCMSTEDDQNRYSPFDFTADEVEEWFKTFQDGTWAKYGDGFAGINGRRMSAMTKEMYVEKAGSIVGRRIHEDWMREKNEARSEKIKKSPDDPGYMADRVMVDFAQGIAPKGPKI